MTASPQTILAPTYRALWGRPLYRSFVLTVGLSRMSSSMFNTAGVLLVLLRTGSAPLAGLTAAAAVVPAALAGPILGAWLDVAARRRVLIVFDQLLSAAALMAIVALAGHAPDWTVPAVTVFYSVTHPFSSGSFYSALAELAGSELLDLASTIEATSINLAVVVGPVIAGVLAAVIGVAETVELQAALTVLVAGLVAANPAFEARGAERARSVHLAVRAGLTGLVREPVLRATTITSSLAQFGWGLMLIGFPLYAVADLHAGAHTSGYLWAGLAGGSIAGTFLLRGAPTLRRVGLSLGVVGLSALLWPLARTLWLGLALIGLTGLVEGPSYAGTIALRQRHSPAAARTQVMTTVASIGQLAIAAGAALAGALHDPVTLVVLFTAVNLVAAAVLLWPGRSQVKLRHADV